MSRKVDATFTLRSGLLSILVLMIHSSEPKKDTDDKESGCKCIPGKIHVSGWSVKQQMATACRIAPNVMLRQHVHMRSACSFSLFADEIEHMMTLTSLNPFQVQQDQSRKLEHSHYTSLKSRALQKTSCEAGHYFEIKVHIAYFRQQIISASEWFE